MLRRLEVDADAMSNVATTKATKPWIGSAREAKTRQGMACPVGNGRRKRAKRLGAKMHLASRQQAMFDPDQSVGYAGVMPAAPHRALHQWARPTNHRERVNHPWSQRVSRLVRESLSFSKKRSNHLGASTLFICHGNLTRA